MRDAYRHLVQQGWIDALRALHPGERIYTLWKFFRNAFACDAGLRIDHLLLSPAIVGRLVAAGVDRDVRAAKGQAITRRSGSNLRIREPLADPAAPWLGILLSVAGDQAPSRATAQGRMGLIE